MTIQDKIDLTMWVALSTLILLAVVVLWMVWKDIQHDEWEDGYKAGREDYEQADAGPVINGRLPRTCPESLTGYHTMGENGLCTACSRQLNGGNWKYND